MARTGEFFDDLETRDPGGREASQMATLPQIIGRAKEKAPGFAKILRGFDPGKITSREALARLPVTRKGDLVKMQADDPPFAGLNTLAPGEAQRLFASPGPIYEYESPRVGFWRIERALHAAGFRSHDIVHNCFSYHLTPGGWMLDGACRALGCTVIPGGVGNSEQQVAAIAHLRPTAWTGTPDYLKVLLDKAAELGFDCGSIDKAMVSGGALFPSLREEYERRGISVSQCYATADLGLIAYESPAREGMIVDEAVLVEIVRPGSGTPLPAGEVGEVVVTSFNRDYPLVRFGTGDLSCVLPGKSPCGRTNMRLKGWMGRADQAAKVKGMFVQPSQVNEVLRRHPVITRARLVVDRDGESDIMTLKCEVAAPAEGLAEKIADSLQNACKIKGEVELVESGKLANDGKVIDDVRKYD